MMSENTLVNMNEIKRHHSYDANGYIFSWNDKIYRAIYLKTQESIIRLWDCGLISELIELKLFPESRITEYRTTDSNLIFEHQKIDVITNPCEWSFNMLKDAALLTLKVNQIARKYGYQTVDAHGFNVAFYKGRALFIDLGSFIELSNDFNCKDAGWRPYGEFMRSFYAPLKMWSKGEEFFSRQSLYGDQMPMASYWRYRSKVARLIPKSYLDRFEYVWYGYKALNTVPVADFLRLASVSEAREKLGQRILAFSKRKGLPLSSVNLDRLTRDVSAIKPPNISSTWGDYHKDKQVDDRQQYIIDSIKKYKPVSALDMAGNAGFFSKVISEIDGVNYVICADYDINAIDRLHTSLRNNSSDNNLYPAVMNFSRSIGDTKFPSETLRFQTEMVLALALTHHLILTQNLTIEFIMSRLSKFTSKYVAVEFMPLGLYSSTNDKNPDMPEWYTIDWFRDGFSKYFNLLDEKEIAKNRIIFIGELKE